ncbi:MAG: glycosyltransferase family 4 protein [Bhargavaea sp.]
MIIAILVTLIAVLLYTPVVKRAAVSLGAIDKPNYRRINTRNIPRMGGLAIVAAFMTGLIVAKPDNEDLLPILIGALIITVAGVLDDILDITAKAKLFFQLIAAGVVVVYGGLHIEFINLPFGGQLDFGYLSVPLTIIWIIGITNAINLIDGLDGLAAGVSMIASCTLAVMAVIMQDSFVVVMAVLLAVSCAGFLFYNFYPAKIFMGDSGSLFLGYMISVLALLGFKNVTIISLVIPILILGIPILDTLFAIVRRVKNKQPISAPDMLHLHHCLINTGFSHRQSVLLIYVGSIMLGGAAILFSQATVWGALVITVIILLAMELIVEFLGLAGRNYRPILGLVRQRK